jgi:ribosomal protein S18 acetylase RimI-like enzyme
MASPVILRSATTEDEAFLLTVYASTRTEELATTPWDDAQKADFCKMQFTAQNSHYRQHYPTAEYSIIVAADVAVGRLSVDRWPREIRIMDIAILPAHRRQGIASHLLKDLQSEAAAKGRSLTIHVERFNPALPLYQRLGFRILEDKGVYLLLQWQLAPAVR